MSGSVPPPFSTPAAPTPASAPVSRRASKEAHEGYVPRAKKRLFSDSIAPVDHQELTTSIQQENNKFLELKQQKWNFDFIKDEPLTGVHQWSTPHPCPNRGRLYTI
eukprot:gnl/Hemi2/3904_TR1368_c0_g1_i1.p1 gnl/Hemi2/3904_TR1368_c0_g1~~gnl/Hemi2/3904_TR1368_c0_g1_i1.p1  ORF type:complete len:106 (+),score=34.81 gnl/Hemi2/3904_TR1368_c0_g1_i1:175-492(+)